MIRLHNFTTLQISTELECRERGAWCVTFSYRASIVVVQVVVVVVKQGCPVIYVHFCARVGHGASRVKVYPGSANAHDRRNGVPGV